MSLPHFYTISPLPTGDSCDEFFGFPCSKKDAEPKYIIVLIKEFIGFRAYTSFGTKPPMPLTGLLVNCSMNQTLVSSSTLGFFITSYYLHPLNKKETSCFPCPSQALYFSNALFWLLCPSLKFPPQIKFFFLGGISSHSIFFLRSWLVP